MNFRFKFPYTADPRYNKRIAYFCMEYAIHQPLKTYAGGLGFLAGSFLRSAYEVKQNVVGVGILWKYGYYDQVRKIDQTMDVLFQEKIYGFLKKTDIKFTISIAKHEVFVTAYYLPPEVFGTPPLFFLSTDIPENDYLAQTISHKLYDSNIETKTAAATLLGIGGAKLLELIEWEPELYHLNESHAISLACYLYSKNRSIQAVRQKLVFTNHTPEPGGNQKTDIYLLEKMGFLYDLSANELKDIAGITNSVLDHTVMALKMSSRTNSVSGIHNQTLLKTYKDIPNCGNIINITNAQNFKYWADKEMYAALDENNDEALQRRKSACKRQLFEEVADQDGEIYDENIFTLVFAKRFAGYKRADLLFRNMERFEKIVTNTKRPVQIIWAGKPYPVDYAAITVFDKIVNLSKAYSNCSVLLGYELKLSKLLKQGADVWLNVPRLTHEASGTSGMSAAMNGAINLSIPDGWFPEFAKHGVNSFVIPAADVSLAEHAIDDADAENLYNLLEHTIIPMYYDDKPQWLSIIKNGMKDIIPQFDSNRMVDEYYRNLYAI